MRLFKSVLGALFALAVIGCQTTGGAGLTTASVTGDDADTKRARLGAIVVANYYLGDARAGGPMTRYFSPTELSHLEEATSLLRACLSGGDLTEATRRLNAPPFDGLAFIDLVTAPMILGYGQVPCVDADPAEARRTIETAAIAGNPAALTMRALLKAPAARTPNDKDLIKIWLARAAAEGFLPAKAERAWLIALSEGVWGPRAVQARADILEAAETGYLPATSYAVVLFEEPLDDNAPAEPDRARYWQDRYEAILAGLRNDPFFNAR